MARVHVIQSTSDPSTAPAFVGQHHINTSSGRHWLAKDTGSVADWVEFVDSSGFVPYNGATQSVDLGAFDLVANSVSTDLVFPATGAGLVLAQVGGAPSVHVQDKQLINQTGDPVVKWDFGVLEDEANNTSVEWFAGGGRRLFDDTGGQSLLWHLRRLIASDTSTIVVDWSGTPNASASLSFNEAASIAAFVASITATGTITGSNLSGTNTGDQIFYNVSSINSNTSAVSGMTYLCDTSGGIFTLTLPAHAANAFVIVKDKTGSFNTNKLIVARNGGTGNIDNVPSDFDCVQNLMSLTFVSDGTGWYVL